ncbi:MAG: RNA methyltransferase [Elusimicrobia bacterium]|nr:RNA methyltransferase [Elusimicrobiota bacterium]
MAGRIEPRFVLVRVRNSLNIGAAARAMTNFGFKDLAAVEPFDPRWREASASAIYGDELLKTAPVLSMAQAAEGCRLVLGTASAHNRSFRQPQVTLPALRAWLRRRMPGGGRVAILFGSEKSGLSNEELDHCHALVRIPTQDDAPSMNLGQAVALMAYELARASLESSASEPKEPMMEGRQVEELVDTAMRAMAKGNVNMHMSERTRRLKFRRGLMRWRMTQGDAAFMHGLLKRLI